MAKKKILLINDMCGYGKVASAAMLPILSYMGHITYSLPTALVSNNLEYGKFNLLDTTDYITGVFPVWKSSASASTPSPLASYRLSDRHG